MLKRPTYTAVRYPVGQRLHNKRVRLSTRYFAETIHSLADIENQDF